LRLVGHNGSDLAGEGAKTRSIAVKRGHPGLAPNLQAQAEAGPLIRMMRRESMGFP
jgi:hypothetical protein